MKGVPLERVTPYHFLRGCWISAVRGRHVLCLMAERISSDGQRIHHSNDHFHGGLGMGYLLHPTRCSMTAEIIDAANELAQLRVDQAVASMRIDRNAVSATHCEGCGDHIKEARRVAVPGCQMCAECQDTTEKLNKHRR